MYSTRYSITNSLIFCDKFINVYSIYYSSQFTTAVKLRATQFTWVVPRLVNWVASQRQRYSHNSIALHFRIAPLFTMRDSIYYASLFTTAVKLCATQFIWVVTWLVNWVARQGQRYSHCNKTLQPRIAPLCIPRDSICNSSQFTTALKNSARLDLLE